MNISFSQERIYALYTEHRSRLSGDAWRVGVGSVDDLFADIPAALKLRYDLRLPAPHSEMEVVKTLRALSAMNASVDEYVSF